MKTPRVFFLTILITLTASFSFTQDIYIESFHTGEKADLSDQEKGTIQKMYIYLDEMYIDYLAKDASEDLELDTRLLITDMRKTITKNNNTSYSFRVAFFDGEDLGKLDITLVEDEDNLIVGCLEGLYFIGKYVKN